MGAEFIRVAAGSVARVVLNRPQARNALNAKLIGELEAAFREIAKDPASRAVLLSGEGPDFCAGADVEWMREGGRMSPEAGREDARRLAAMLSAVDDCPVPVIAAARGGVFGGGLGILAACDVAILADDARLCFSEAKLGLAPAVISCWVLPKIGVSNARRWYLTAETIAAAQAAAMGLAHEVVPAAGLMARAEEVASAVRKCGPRAVRASKAMIRRLAAASPAERPGLAVETLVELRSGSEGQEGLAAFLEKRPPAWAAKT